MPHITAIANQKGGVGKSTTTLNLGVGLARKGKRVLIVDADPQGTITDHLGHRESAKLENTLASVMEMTVKEHDFEVNTGILSCAEGVDLMPSNSELSNFELFLNAVKEGREYVLIDYLDKVKAQYDHILIDSLPSLGVLFINILVAADTVIIPVQAEYTSVLGLTDMLKSIGRVRRRLNPNIDIDGILFTMVDSRVRITKETMQALKESYGAQINIFNTDIPYSVRVKESNQNAQSIYTYEPNGKCALAYENFTAEVLEKWTKSMS